MKNFLDRYRAVFNVPDVPPAGAPPAESAPGAPPAGTPPPAATSPAWLSPALPQETRDFLAAQDFGKNETPDSALLHLHNLHKLSQSQGDVIAKPKDANDIEGWNKFYSALGRPEAPDKYELKLPDGYTADPELLGVARKAAFDMGADPAKAQALVDGYLAYETKAREAITASVNQANAAAVEALKTTYGEGFNKFVADGQRAADALGLTQAEKDFFDLNKGSAVVMGLMARIGKGMGENPGGFLSTGASAGGANTPEQALEALNTLRNSPRFAEIMAAKGRHPEHQSVLAEMDRLGKIAYPSRRA